MLSTAPKFVQYPLDTAQIYWLRYPRKLFSPANFFFASSNGGELLPAMNDLPRFITALADAIAEFPDAGFTAGLQQLLLDLTTADVPAPRYPQVGDTNVSGQMRWVLRLTTYVPADPQNTPPPWTNLPPIWVGHVVADIVANSYSTPPANSEIQFTFQVRSNTELAAGQAVRFDIVQGSYAPYATNVR